MKRGLVIVFLTLLVLITGCTKYVCYDGTVKGVSNLCPMPQIPKLTDYDAGKFVDNYGGAVAEAKGDVYTRVNLYAQNGSWYSKAVFSNRDAQTLKEVQFRIDGETGDVRCIAGCEYLTFKK